MRTESQQYKLAKCFSKLGGLILRHYRALRHQASTFFRLEYLEQHRERTVVFLSSPARNRTSARFPEAIAAPLQ